MWTAKKEKLEIRKKKTFKQVKQKIKSIKIKHKPYVHRKVKREQRALSVKYWKISNIRNEKKIIFEKSNEKMYISDFCKLIKYTLKAIKLRKNVKLDLFWKILIIHCRKKYKKKNLIWRMSLSSSSNWRQT